MTLGDDSTVTAVAVVELARDGRFAEVEDLFAPSLRAAVPVGTLQAAWTTTVAGNGPIRGVGEPASEPGAGGVGIPVTCERGGFTVLMSFDDAGMLNGLRLAPAVTGSWTPPAYSAVRKFAEHEVTVGSGELAVPGTMTLPRGRGRRPGVVLLSGGGPFDRDETSGPNKPLKDLAWGLASRGVAVLRFDKVTFSHSQAANTPGFTMSDEYVPYAVSAVRLLQQQPAVDPARVFVLGHSMGGKVAPRVAAAEESVAGLVLLAADAQPMHQAAVRVIRHLSSINVLPESAVESMTRQAALVAGPDLAATTPAADLPFGLSGSYWLDLRDYDPVAAAAALDKPMFILQGGRDYQVTVEDDLARWKAGLRDRPDVTVRVYEADNHLFFTGEGPSTPAEYEVAQHVDPAVVSDIAEWLKPARQKLTRRLFGSRTGR